MHNFDEFQKSKWFMQSTYYNFYHAIRNDRKCILKVLKSEKANNSQIEKIHHEYKILKELDGSGSPNIYGLFPFEKTYFIELEDIEGKALSEIYENNRMSNKEFIQLALNITKALSFIHNKNIIHKDINPSNIIYNDKSKDLRIIDFGIASKLSPEKMYSENVYKLEGTLPFISPEQTGRTNQLLDYRTDFYSLGITFYKLLTGLLPFATKEPFDLIHAHITKIAQSPNSLNADIPYVLSELIMKLMAKNPEDRYQSIQGITYDLKEIERQIEHKENLSFQLGRNDIHTKFIFKENFLYARKEEISLFQNKLIDAVHPPINLTFIEGETGIGKSRLINEFQRNSQVDVFKSTFSKAGNNLPYSGIIECLKAIVLDILIKEEHDIENWRKTITEGLSGNEKIICDLIPKLSSIIGTPKDILSLGAEQEQTRFIKTVVKFIEVVCNKRKPIILSFDNFHEADANSVILLQEILKESKNIALFMIFLYRREDLVNNLSANKFVEDNIDNENSLHIILHKLTTEDIAQMISDATGLSIERVRTLANVVDKKANGNPFFAKQFLLSAIKDGHIKFDPKQSEWQWDLHLIGLMETTDNVISMLLSKIKNLPDETKKQLAVASLIGEHFNTKALKEISIMQSQTLTQSIFQAITEGFLIIENSPGNSEANLGMNCRFSHNKIREAFIEQVNFAEKTNIHFALAKWLEKMEPSKIDIFQLANHVNNSKNIWLEQGNVWNFIEINARAAESAKHSFAFSKASNYLKNALLTLPSDCWDENYSLTYSIHKSYAECRYLLQDYTTSKKVIDLIIKKSRTKFDMLKIYNLLTTQYSTNCEYEKALYNGSKSLSLLGFTLPDYRDFEKIREDFKYECSKFYAKLGSGTISEISLPTTLKDQNIIEVLEIYSTLCDAALVQNRALLDLIAVTGVNLSLEHGISSHSAVMVIIFAAAFTNEIKDLSTAKELMDLANKIIHLFPEDRQNQMRIFAYQALYINHWTNNPDLISTTKSLEPSIEQTEILYTSYLYYAGIHPAFILGTNLIRLYEICDQAVLFAKDGKVPLIHDLVLPSKLLIENLIDGIYDDFADVPNFNEQEFLIRWQNTPLVICAYYIRKMELEFFLNRFDAAITMGHLAKPHLETLGGQSLIADFYIYWALSHAFVEKNLIAVNAKKDALETAINFFKNATKFANIFYENFILWLEGELHYNNENIEQCLKIYSSTIPQWQKQNCFHFLALAYERLANIWRFSFHNDELFEIYISKAYRNFKIWGAKVATQRLEKSYPNITFKKGDETPFSRFTISSSINSFEIDIENIINASNIISSEINLDNLIDKMLEICKKNAGADYAKLILKSENELLLTKKSSTGKYEFENFENSDEIPKTIIHSVEKTSKLIIIHNASEEDFFAKDPYLIKNKPLSILCLPIIKNQTILGIFYLENRVTKYAFTEKNTRVTSLLISNVSSSIENAQLYRTLEKRVAERTQQVLLAQRRLIDASNMAALGEMAGGVAHEINNPITIIDGFSRRIKTMIENGTPDLKQIVNFCERIENMVLRISGIIKALQTFARDDGLSEIELVNLRILTENVFSKIQDKFEAAAIKLNFSITNADTNLHCNANQISQVLYNLLNNSYEATQNLPEKIVSVDILDEADRIVIMVTDSGKISKEEIANNLFKPFFTTKEIGRGTGLGLSVASGIVRSHNGEITLDRNHPTTRFVITLPKILRT